MKNRDEILKAKCEEKYPVDNDMDIYAMNEMYAKQHGFKDGVTSDTAKKYWSNSMFIELNLTKELNLNAERCAEIIELQRIMSISKDGIFGAKTFNECKNKFGKASISLRELKYLGHEIRTEIPISELWWVKIIYK